MSAKEQEQQSTAQLEQVQSFYHHAEDEISLADLLEVLIRKRVLILAITSICTLLSILYVQSITPTYQATIGFLPPEEINFTSHFPDSLAEILPDKAWYSETGQIIKENKSLFYKFLTIIQSYQLQEKVATEGNFLKRFVDDDSVIATEEKELVWRINQSIQMGGNNNGKKEGSKETFDRTIYLDMNGTKPKVISDFLNTLAESAKNEVINNTKKLIQREIKAQISKLSFKLENLRINGEAERLKKISRYSKNLEIAKSLGILKNNFSSLTTNTPLTFVFDEKQKAPMGFDDEKLPIWYLYGQHALEKKLDVLKRQSTSDQYMKEIAELNSQIANLSRIDLSQIIFDPVIVSQSSIPPTEPIKPDKIKAIAIGMAVGLFIGFIMAFLRNSIDQLKIK